MSGNRLGKGSHVAPDMRRNAEGPAYHWKVSPVGDRGRAGNTLVGESLLVSTTTPSAAPPNQRVLVTVTLGPS